MRIPNAGRAYYTLAHRVVYDGSLDLDFSADVRCGLIWESIPLDNMVIRKGEAIQVLQRGIAAEVWRSSRSNEVTLQSSRDL
jgi:hypothetical protein